jgi:hypothetical protein
MNTTRTLVRTLPRLARLTRPINNGPDRAGIPTGTLIVVEVTTTQTTRADGTECRPSAYVRVNGHHQYGCPAAHLGSDGWPDLGFAVYVDEPIDLQPTPGDEATPRAVVSCPGCAEPIVTPNRPTGGDWTERPFWCAPCGGTAAQVKHTPNLT